MIFKFTKFILPAMKVILLIIFNPSQNYTAHSKFLQPGGLLTQMRANHSISQTNMPPTHLFSI